MDLSQTWFEVLPSAREVVNFLQEHAKAKSVRIRCKCDITKPVFSDQSKFQQLLINLITNAIKHAPRGSVINVELRYNASLDFLCVKVTDAGPGFARLEDIEFLFKP